MYVCNDIINVGNVCNDMVNVCNVCSIVSIGLSSVCFTYLFHLNAKCPLVVFLLHCVKM